MTQEQIQALNDTLRRMCENADKIERAKGSEYLIAKEVKKFWRRTYPADVVCYFKQKYEHEKDWEWMATIGFYNGYDMDSVNFLHDFWEGQTCVKDITIVNLDDVMEYYYDNVIDKTGG